MKKIQHTSTLFYYDGPQVFEARDTIGGHYIAVMVDSDGPDDRYLVAGVAPERLREFRSGILDLRRLLIDSDVEGQYLATVEDGLNSPLALDHLSLPLTESGFLPEAGFVLHDRPSDDFVVKEARERNNLVLEVIAEPPEAAIHHRIRASTLARLLQHIQTMVTLAHQAVIKDKSVRRQQPDSNLLDVVVPAAAGSFRVLLEAACKPDLLDDSEIAIALPQVDNLFEHAASPEDTLAVVMNNRGHLAGAYLKFLRFLKESHTGIHYSWAGPKSQERVSRGVSQIEAGPLVEKLSQVQKLGSEAITLVGTFEKFNRNTDAWGLRTADETRSGKIGTGGPSLDGLEVGGSYRFYCDEEIEETGVTGKEQRTLYLNRHEEI